MMKYSILCLLLFISTVAIGQKAIKDETPIQTINRIFKAYMAQAEATDILENKEAMSNAIHILQKTDGEASDKKDLSLLVRVWLDYNPPNFHTRKLIEPILFMNKVATIEVINELLLYKQSWESRNTSPGSDLEKLREKISQN
ncbi:MAG: hypothetical protein ABI402_11090 [Ferruginibacter sp.]